MIKQRLDDLRKQMLANDIDVYFFNTNDYHMSEYVPQYFKTIAYFSGFTGSLASFIVSQKEAVIFVDGRYHIQADQQCSKYDIKVIKLGLANQPEVLDYLSDNYGDKKIGLDGKRVAISFIKKLKAKGLNLIFKDIYSPIIVDRVALSIDPIYELDIAYTGLSRKQKLEMVHYCLQDKIHVVNNLESIAYLLNLRGNDILYTPTFMAYMVIKDEYAYLFVNTSRLSPELIKELNEDKVIVKPYDDYYHFLENINERTITLDENKVNYQTYIALLNGNNKFINQRSLIEQMKSIKNPLEQDNSFQAHIFDGVAMVRFFMWLDSVDKSKYSEYDIAQKINACRLDYKAVDLSFESIVAYNENAAINHYFPIKGESKMLDNKGILLMDTGGQYYQGTTDVTRTVALGEVDQEVKKCFTLVLKSLFNVSTLTFLEGLDGRDLDLLFRKDLWAQGLDFRHGSGHGIGQMLSVHEFPPNVRHSKFSNGESGELVPFKPGMIFSDEPGLYFDNKFGIRCENVLLCKKAFENDFGTFLTFDTLTLIPFDLNLIDKNYLDEATIIALNDYHQQVYRTLYPYLNDDERAYLKEKTRNI